MDDQIAKRSFDGEVVATLRHAQVWDMTLPWLESYQDIRILSRFRHAGYTFISLTVEDFPPTFQGVLDAINGVRRMVEAEADWLALATSPDEVWKGQQAGKLVLGLNVQDSVQLETDLSRLRALRSAGIMHMQLSYNSRNFVADGCAESSDAGLSIFGRQVIREMNNIGMVIDCSHAGRRSTLDAMEISQQPTIFSHSGVRALSPHIRNIDDEQIRACAAGGGVVGIVGIGAFLGDAEARTETLFRHIDYIANFVGPEHVGLGTDYVSDMQALWSIIRTQKDKGWPDPTGSQLYEGSCVQPEQLPQLVRQMLDHGYDTKTVHGILGRNFQRVYNQVVDHPA